MGGVSAPVDCTDSSLSCASGEPQEVCLYGSARVIGHRPGQPCDWGSLNYTCTSLLAACECPVGTAGVATSALGKYTANPTDAAFVYTGPAMLWIFTLLLLPLYKCTSWKRTFQLPRALAEASPGVLVAWLGLCVVATAVLIGLGYAIPASAWGDCAARGVCVYHMMFCEATRHHSIVRHPANTWSNLPYLYMALGLSCLVVDEHVRRRSRPYQLLDTLFAAVLLCHTCASVAWHASNCTDVHFIDIGLMNSVIAFFPLRFGGGSLALALGLREGRAFDAALAAAFAALVLSQLAWASGMTPLYHRAFPTGHSRYLTLQPVEIMLYIGLPGLYPLPALVRMWLSRTWGCVPALVVTVVSLPLGFCMHAVERLVIDLRCDPTSWLTQPTACFHICSGLAIASAYVVARALEEDAHAV